MSRNKLLVLLAGGGGLLFLVGVVLFAPSGSAKPAVKAKIEPPVTAFQGNGGSSGVNFIVEEDLPVVITRIPPDVTPEEPNPYDYPPPIRPVGWLVVGQLVGSDGYDMSHPADWVTEREDTPDMNILSLRLANQNKNVAGPLFRITTTSWNYTPSIEERERSYEAMGFVKTNAEVNPSAPLAATQWSGTIPAAQSPSGKALQQTHIAVLSKQHVHQIVYSYEGEQQNPQTEKFFRYMVSTIKFK